jgi:hypothetical protein
LDTNHPVNLRWLREFVEVSVYGNGGRLDLCQNLNFTVLNECVEPLFVDTINSWIKEVESLDGQKNTNEQLDLTKLETFCARRDTGNCLSKAEIMAKIKASRCSKCQGTMSPQARRVRTILGKPMKTQLMLTQNMRDRLRLMTSTVGPTPPCPMPEDAVAIAKENLSPFQDMNLLVQYLDNELKKFGGDTASLLGPYDIVYTPLPLYRLRSNGRLIGFFWHGSSSEHFDAIRTEALKNNYEKTGNMLYGRGIYSTPQACKTTQYTNEEGTAMLLLCIVFMGTEIEYARGPIAAKDIEKISMRTTIATPGFTKRDPARGLKQEHWEVVAEDDRQVVPLLAVQFSDKFRAAPWSADPDLIENCAVQ